MNAPEPIRALFDQSVALNDEAHAVSLEAEAASDPATAKALEEKSERIGNQALACESAIFKTPARTIDELIVKARRAYWWCTDGDFDFTQAPDPSKVASLDDQSTIWSILQDIESLAAPAAIAAPAVPASMAPVAEDPIVGLWRQVLDHRAEASRLENLAIEAKKRGDDAERSRLSALHGDEDNKWLSIETEILQMNALTTKGWAIQAELLADHGSSRIDGADERVAERIAQHFRRMADAEQLAASGDAKVRALHAAWQEAQKATSAASDRAQNATENGQPNADALWELAEKVVGDEIAAYDRFIEAPAGTVPVMLLKLDAWTKHQAEDLNPAAPLAVMRDLKRLAGGAS